MTNELLADKTLMLLSASDEVGGPRRIRVQTFSDAKDINVTIGEFLRSYLQLSTNSRSKWHRSHERILHANVFVDSDPLELLLNTHTTDSIKVLDASLLIKIGQAR